MKKITKNHNNRKLHNWVIYNCYEKFMRSNANLFSGVLFDLGAGELPYKDFFLQYAEQYIAVDWAASFHDTKADIVADLNKPLPIESGVADTVVSFSVIEHLCEPQSMLNEAYRILKSGGGTIVLQVPWQWWIHEAPYDYFRYTPYGLKYMLGKAGFVDIKVEPHAGYFTTAILKWNYFTNRFVRGPKLLRCLIKTCLLPFWYLGQKTAPILDKLDHHWMLEASGYYVTASKP